MDKEIREAIMAAIGDRGTDDTWNPLTDVVVNPERLIEKLCAIASEAIENNQRATDKPTNNCISTCPYLAEMCRTEERLRDEIDRLLKEKEAERER